MPTPPLPPRRFLPQPIELSTTTKSNRATPAAASAPNGLASSRKIPQPLETSTKSNRKAAEAQVTDAAPESTPSPRPPAASIRKFAPQLIETTKRSRRGKDPGPALLLTDRTEVSPGDKSYLPRHLRQTGPGTRPPLNTPAVSVQQVPQALESRFSSLELGRRAPRRTSLRVPDLASIPSQPESEESTDSNCPSLSTSPSAESDETEPHKHASRVRESCDDRFSGYLLALAARAAEKQLREQAMAAFPNSTFHEQVDHFAINRESGSSDDEEMGVGRLPREAGVDAGRLRRESAGGWDVVEMRQHQQKLAQQHEERKRTEQPEICRLDPSNGPFRDATQGAEQAQHAMDAFGGPKHIIGGWQKDVHGLKCMRNAASPPMLGDDLRFPKCQSPRQTRLDVDQYPCKQRAPGVATPHQRSGLWTPGGGNSRQGSAGGLWMGLFTHGTTSSLAPPKLVQNGLLTPASERDNPFESIAARGESALPLSPPDSQEGSSMAHVDFVLSYEQAIADEFDDDFVTQVYNYLSLGYPTMARKYDEELSKISRIPLDDLRHDDHRKNTKGYVGAPEGNGAAPDEVRNGQCGRWNALRLYVREWARQQPNMAERDEGADWGNRARRGSWAI
ncbi:MAG: hypothetical protein LQ347_002422 [Umbilicaria vellea]|nr:MAG: hypothetical protein LQ347_002422 [Umbilicaria vellea]